MVKEDIAKAEAEEDQVRSGQAFKRLSKRD